jgi:hypothetical protein
VRGGHAILRGVPGALTGAVHLGLVVSACALAAAAVPAVIVLRANTGDAGTGRRRPEPGAAAGRPATPIRPDLAGQPGREAAGPGSAP